MKTIACLILTTLLIAPGKAALIDLGDITLDDETGFEWLDVTLTAGQSVQSVLAGYGGYIDDGFEYATRTQVESLFHAAQIPCFLPSQCGSYGTFTPQNWWDVTRLHLLVGVTEASSTLSKTRAFWGLGSPSPSEVYVAQLLANLHSGYAVLDVDTEGQSFAHPEYGSFLVRSVPAPSTIWTLSTLLVALVAVRLSSRAYVRLRAAICRSTDGRPA